MCVVGTRAGVRGGWGGLEKKEQRDALLWEDAGRDVRGAEVVRKSTQKNAPVNPK
jgi:hypothetical protein